MNRQIGAQYYTIREHIQDLTSFEESCKRIADMGYRIVQISGTPLKAADMKPVLDRYHLKTVVTHRNFNDFLADPGEVIEYNRILGCEICGIGIMPLEYQKSSETVTDFIQKANTIAQRFREQGLKFAYHNHALEFGKFDGVRIIDRLLAETDPEAFYFIVDTFWIQAGGCNPVDFIRSLGKRAVAVHFKDFTIDVADWQKPQMAEVGQGNLDWDAMIAACEEAGTQWALVEQDFCKGDPFQALQTSYEYLRTKGFC